MTNSPGAGTYPLTSLVATDQIRVDRSDSAVGNYATPAVFADAVTANRPVAPYLTHTGGVPATSNTFGTNTTPVTTAAYLTIVTIPGDTTITGVALLNGTTSSGSVKHYLATSTGSMIASTASTAMAGSSSYQRIAFTAPYSAKGPATFIIATQINDTAQRFRTHVFGDFPTWSTTGTFGTFPTFTPTTTFITGVGPVISLF